MLCLWLCVCFILNQAHKYDIYSILTLDIISDLIVIRNKRLFLGLRVTNIAEYL